MMDVSGSSIERKADPSRPADVSDNQYAQSLGTENPLPVACKVKKRIYTVKGGHAVTLSQIDIGNVCLFAFAFACICSRICIREQRPAVTVAHQATTCLCQLFIAVILSARTLFLDLCTCSWMKQVQEGSA